MKLPPIHAEYAWLYFMRRYTKEAYQLASEHIEEDINYRKLDIADIIGCRLGFEWDEVRAQDDEWRRYSASVWGHYSGERRRLKQQRAEAKARLKRRYNIVHRLRLRGIAIDTDSNAINIAGEQEYRDKEGTTRRYIDTLRDEYKFAIQTYIPGAEGEAPSGLKFKRKRR